MKKQVLNFRNGRSIRTATITDITGEQFEERGVCMWRGKRYEVFRSFSSGVCDWHAITHYR